MTSLLKIENLPSPLAKTKVSPNAKRTAPPDTRPNLETKIFFLHFLHFLHANSHLDLHASGNIFPLPAFSSLGEHC